MDIDSFVAKYGPLWRRLEGATAGNRVAPPDGPASDRLVSDYLTATGHLAEARTRYQDPALVGYLTRVVAQAHARIYGVRPRSRRDVLRLFGVRYRAAFRSTLPHILVAAALLAGVTTAVAGWTALSPEAQAGLVPGLAERAADAADTDLREPSASLTGFLFLNNVRVALLAFALGVTLGLGTVMVVVFNGALIGALAGGSMAIGQAGRFWALVLPHGFLELTAIVLAAGAGLRIGWAIVEPGDRDRRDALADETRAATLVALGVAPAFLIAALIEGLVTGVTGWPVAEVLFGALVTAGYLRWLARPVTARRAP